MSEPSFEEVLLDFLLDFSTDFSCFGRNIKQNRGKNSIIILERGLLLVRISLSVCTNTLRALRGSGPLALVNQPLVLGPAVSLSILKQGWWCWCRQGMVRVGWGGSSPISQGISKTFPRFLLALANSSPQEAEEKRVQRADL